MKKSPTGCWAFFHFLLNNLVQFQNSFTAAKKIFHPNQEQPLSEEYINHIKSRFRREVLILSSISHPDVVSVLRSEVDLEPPS